MQFTTSVSWCTERDVCTECKLPGLVSNSCEQSTELAAANTGAWALTGWSSLLSNTVSQQSSALHNTDTMSSSIASHLQVGSMTQASHSPRLMAEAQWKRTFPFSCSFCKPLCSRKTMSMIHSTGQVKPTGNKILFLTYAAKHWHEQPLHLIRPHINY